MAENNNQPLTKPILIYLLYEIKKNVENWSIFRFKYHPENIYFHENLKILKKIRDYKMAINQYERDDDESAIEGRREICRKLFGDNDISENGEFYHYEQDDFNEIKSHFTEHLEYNFAKNL